MTTFSSCLNLRQIGRSVKNIFRRTATKQTERQAMSFPPAEDSFKRARPPATRPLAPETELVQIRTLPVPENPLRSRLNALYPDGRPPWNPDCTLEEKMQKIAAMKLQKKLPAVSRQTPGSSTRPTVKPLDYPAAMADIKALEALPTSPVSRETFIAEVNKIEATLTQSTPKKGASVQQNAQANKKSLPHQAKAAPKEIKTPKQLIAETQEIREKVLGLNQLLKDVQKSSIRTAEEKHAFIQEIQQELKKYRAQQTALFKTSRRSLR